ncbi:MAG: sodium:proton antiporter NhaD [Micavibrio sp.]
MKQTPNLPPLETLPNLLLHPGAILCLIVFILSYAAVLAEEKTHMRKSKPVLFGAGIIWIIIALVAKDSGMNHTLVRDAVNHGIAEYGSLMLFLLAAMTYISTLQERRVFDTMRSKMVAAGMSMRQIFWATGIAAFFLSPVADNMTTALVLGAVVVAVGGDNKKFIAMACINVVCAANAGGAFSPFGDITTLMVWQAGQVEFFEFFALFLPSVVCFLVPALCMNPFLPQGTPDVPKESVTMKYGGKVIIVLGLFTIATAISFEQLLHLPAFLGMMTGMAVLMLYAWYLEHHLQQEHFDIIELVAESEWDTLLFFFGVIFSVGGLAFLGYLGLASNFMYEGWGPGTTNIAIGLFSAVIDNIPVMFAVLSMNPDMDHFQWLLVTLTAGVGGSLLSIGSAAGVALMGVARGQYTFLSHLKWTPVILLGYVAAIGTHYILNAP